MLTPLEVPWFLRPCLRNSFFQLSLVHPFLFIFVQVFFSVEVKKGVYKLFFPVIVFVVVISTTGKSTLFHNANFILFQKLFSLHSFSTQSLRSYSSISRMIPNHFEDYLSNCHLKKITKKNLLKSLPYPSDIFAVTTQFFNYRNEWPQFQVVGQFRKKLYQLKKKFSSFLIFASF